MIGFEEIVGKVAAPRFRSGLITGDVLKILRDHPIEIKFDVVIADPPYNIGKNFGKSDDNLPLDEYVEWTGKWISRCFQLLSENGLIYIYGFAEILSHISALYPADHQRWLVWHYTNKAVPSLRFWQRSHESIFCLWMPETKRPVLEVDQIREPYTKSFLNNAAGKTRRSTVSRFGGNQGKETTYRAHEGGALPRDVIKIPALAGGAGASERWFMCRDCGDGVFPPSELKNHRDHNTLKHPTQKPMRLTKRLIRSRIKGNNGRLLVPFAGSGSECVVAKQLGIEFRGIEINPLYVKFARKWLRCIN